MKRIVFIIRMIAKMLESPFNDYLRMEKFALREIEKHPKFYLSKLYLASLYKDNGLFERAAEYYKLSIVDKIKPHTVFEYARVLYEIGRFHDAINQLDSVKVKMFKNIDARKIYAFCLVETGRYEEAEKVLLSLLSDTKSDNDYKIFESLGYCELKLSKYNESFTYYKKAVELNPNDVNLAEILHKVGELSSNMGNGL